MTDDQIKHMVERFLSWKLPANFNPDGGISFAPEYHTHPWPTVARHEPIGTNLLDYTQATAMVRYMLEGMPTDEERELTAEENAMIDAAWEKHKAAGPSM